MSTLHKIVFCYDIAVLKVRVYIWFGEELGKNKIIIFYVIWAKPICDSLI